MQRLESTVLIAALAASFVSNATAQVPDEFTNLKFLPKDITKRDLVARMRGMAGDLGVQCAFCHVGPENLQGMDFASDEKREKRVAREMLEMLGVIEQTLSRLPPHEGPKGSVTCYTCHRGLTIPPGSTLSVLDETAKTDGIAAALQRYRELRQEQYGHGRYDLSDRALSSFANRLRETERLDDARAVLAVAHEYYPLSARVETAYGWVELAAGDKDKARARFRKALELDPNDGSAQWGLRRLDSPPRER